MKIVTWTVPVTSRYSVLAVAIAAPALQLQVAAVPIADACSASQNGRECPLGFCKINPINEPG
jgi:hypothetical protein